MGCDFNFEKVYEEMGKGFIHVHHIIPLSKSSPTRINPRTDLVVLCPNCHCMVHRDKENTLSLLDLKTILEKNSI